MKKLKDYKQFYQAFTPRFLVREMFRMQGESRMQFELSWVVDELPKTVNSILSRFDVQ